MYHFFHFPDREDYDTPHRVGLSCEQVYFDSADGTRLSGWFIPAQGVASPREAKGTVIHLHGNAQNMTAHWNFAGFVPSRGYNLFTFDYRGYGESEGAPGPQGVFEDSVAALDYLRSRTDIDAGKLFVFGQSLGGMLAIAAAGASPQGVRAVLAEAPFHSYDAMVKDKMPQTGLMLCDNYTATAYVAKLAPIPLLLIHGTADIVVPYTHSVRLLAEAGEPKRLVQIKGGDHVDAMLEEVHGRKYQDEMMAFFDAALEKNGSS
ncbi:MAG: alpha/beta hydrolase [Burkholderiaceae bacterium]|nr:alpha/beta hydrolase [Burkholderiaceae bacterium]